MMLVAIVASTGLQLLAVASGLTAPAAGLAPQAAIRIIGPSDVPSPDGSVVPFELRDGAILVRVRLVLPSGGDRWSTLMLDTGAPGLSVTPATWRALGLDSTHMDLGHIDVYRRPLHALELGSVRIDRVPVDGTLPDALLGGDVDGLLGPSLFGDRAMIIDYEARTLTLVSRSLTIVHAEDAAGPSEGLVGHGAGMRRSRARYGPFIPRGAVAVPMRYYRGGRILVTARIEDPSRGWSSRALTLLLDTGSTASLLFQDAVTERMPRLPDWPHIRGKSRSVLGAHDSDFQLLPRLCLTGTGADLCVEGAMMGIGSRASVPDIAKELSNQVHGLLGYPFLSRHRIVLDYANQVVWLAPATASEGEWSGAHDIGLYVQAFWDNAYVVSVTPGSPAATAGIVFGDVVTAVDGTSIRGLEDAAIAARLHGDAGTEVAIGVRRGMIERVVRVTRPGKR